MKIGITSRLFLAILLATGFAVLSNVLIVQWSLGRGFLRFVNTLEKDGVSRLAVKLEEVYHAEQSWERFRNDPGRWHLLLLALFPDLAPPPHERERPPDLSWQENPPPEPPPRPLSGTQELDGYLSRRAEKRPPAVGRPLPAPRTPPSSQRHDTPPAPPKQTRFMRGFATRLFLLDANRKLVAGRHIATSASDAADTTPLLDQGRVVGYLGFVPNTRLADDRQLRFLKEQKLAFILVASIVVLLAAGLSLLLARRLVRPLRGLADATQKLSSGDFSIRVPVVSGDEVGQLAANFNSLALTLEKNEQARRQWVADISHELRTPLAILRGEIESLQDGIRLPDIEALRSLHSEVLRLSLLVDDLYQLAMSDLGALTYRKETVDLTEVLNEAAASYLPEFAAKGIVLSLGFSSQAKALVSGDPERLRQLFANLLSNALKYTDAGGELRLSLSRHEQRVMVDFQDSAPGVPARDMERLFDRLYRVETSRNRETGGAGLGLSICRNIIEAHQGTISAQPSPLGGVWIRVELALLEES